MTVSIEEVTEGLWELKVTSPTSTKPNPIGARLHKGGEWPLECYNPTFRQQSDALSARVLLQDYLDGKTTKVTKSKKKKVKH
jgi:hypothetical protein